MHIVIISPFPPAITGIGQYGYHVTRALAASGQFSQITVLTGTSNINERPDNLGITEIEIGWKPGDINTWRVIPGHLKRLRPDLVWFNLGVSAFGKSPIANLSGLIAPFFARRETPTVVTLHEIVELSDLSSLRAPGWALAKWGAHLITRVETQADIVCLTMKRYADWLESRKVDCEYIPIGTYYEPDMLEESQIPELLFFTTIAPYKGLELLLDAFPALRKKYPQLRLTIAGAVHTRFPAYSRDMKIRCGKIAGVQWLGQVAENEVINLFRRAQIVVLPYSASTGASSVVYQAATWGRALVASDLNEIRALVTENNLDVQFFKNGNIESFHNAVLRLIESPDLRKIQTFHNFRVIQNARPQDTCRRYIEVFNRALSKRHSLKRIPFPYVLTEIQ
jgi:glycosyltransferase involved in cell wall biosynthesis